MLDRFTDTAKRLITLARERAEERKHSSLSNEHLLEVFLESPDCLAYRLIMEQSPCIDFINRELSNRLNHVPQSENSSINFDDACKKTFERAFMLTDKLKHKGISTGSLILGMLQAESHKTTPLLRGWGLCLKNVLSTLTEIGDPGLNEKEISQLSPDLAVQINRMTEMNEDTSRIIAHAQELAKSCNNAQINPHHFLLSLVFLASRGVIDVSPLNAESFDLVNVKASVASNLKGDVEYADDRVVFDYSLHTAFRIGAVEAFQFGKTAVTATEVALGILHVIPDEASTGLGGDYFSLRWNIIDQMSPIQQTTPEAPPVERVDALIPRISLRRYNTDQSVVILIPEKLAREWQVMALDKRDSTLTVAMVDPSDNDTIAKIEETTGLSVAVIKAEPKDLNAAFRINY